MQSSKIPSWFQPPRYTYEDYKHWPGDWELIYGYAVSLLPANNATHQRTLGSFSRTVQEQIEGAKDVAVYYSLDWIVDNETTVRPDLMIVCGEFETDYLSFPPTLIIEITSASTWVKDRNIKYKLFEQQGVKYYLLADPEKKSYEAFELVNGVYKPYSATSFQLATECAIELDVKSLW